jgi:hypothetical protein
MDRKFRAIHLLSGTDEERVNRSIGDVSRLQEFGIEYKQIHNDLYTELPPKETCMRPSFVSLDPGRVDMGRGDGWNLTPRHYGCFKAHHDGVLENFDESLSGLLVFECDAVCAMSLGEFYSRLCRADDICRKYRNIMVLQLGFRHASHILEKIEELDIIDQFIGTHAYFVPESSRELFCEYLRVKPWDAMDMFYTHYFVTNHLKMAVFNDRPIWNQADGPSYIQPWVSSSEGTYKNWRY